LPSVVAALCDTGPLVALFDPGEAEHRRCRTCLEDFQGRLVTTWPVLTEAFYFLSTRPMRRKLWDFVERGGLAVADLAAGDVPRLGALMEKYASLPMSLADASLVVVGERLGLTRVFTLDLRDFRVYRPRHAESFEIMP